MLGISESGVFCDYLRCTCSPSDSFADPLQRLLTDSLDVSVRSEGDATYFTSAGPYGAPAVARLDRGFWKRVDRITFSGLFMAVLRSSGVLAHVVQEIASVPYNLTRWDGALDVELSSVSAYRRRLGSLRRRGQSRGISLGRKAIHVHQVKAMLGPRALDGAFSGSVMFGHRSNRYSGIVYDKSAELFDRHGVIIDRNLLRYEVRTSEATLNDALDPGPLFYHLASPDLLELPSNILPWTRRELPPMRLDPLPTLLPLQQAKKIISFSPDVRRLVDLVHENPNIRSLVLRYLDSEMSAGALGVDAAKTG